MRLAGIAGRRRLPLGRMPGRGPHARRRPGTVAACGCLAAGVPVLAWIAPSLGWLTLLLAVGYLVALLPLLPLILQERRR